MVKATHAIVSKSLDKLGDNILVYLTLPQSINSLIKNLVLIRNNMDSWIIWYCNFLFAFMSKKKIKKFRLIYLLQVSMVDAWQNLCKIKGLQLR
jgi:hypothetical protein